MMINKILSEVGTAIQAILIRIKIMDQVNIHCDRPMDFQLSFTQVFTLGNLKADTQCHLLHLQHEQVTFSVWSVAKT